MGAILDYRIYTADVLSIPEIEKLWADDVQKSAKAHGTDDSGKIGVMPTKIKSWNDEQLESELMAKRWLEDDDHKTNEAYAVSFKSGLGGMRWMVGGWCND
jgi:hypothetical protein